MLRGLERYQKRSTVLLEWVAAGVVDGRQAGAGSVGCGWGVGEGATHLGGRSLL